MSNGSYVIELCQQSWSELDEDEKAVFDKWLATATDRDLYLLVRYAMRGKKTSSIKRMQAVRGDEHDEEQS